MILLYHRVASLDADPHRLAVSPANLDAQLAVLRNRYCVLPLGELVERTYSGRLGAPRDAVAITFDDGYVDNLAEAKPLLVKHALPATVYLATGFMDRQQQFLHDELERLLLAAPVVPPSVRLTVGGVSREWTLEPPVPAAGPRQRESPADRGWSVERPDDPSPRHRAYRQIHAWLRDAPPAERSGAMRQLRHLCGDNPSATRADCRPLTWDEARQLADGGLVDLGAHTVNHPYLASLPEHEQASEIVGSLRAIEAGAGVRATSFAYPFGMKASYSDGTRRIVADAGFDHACANYRGRLCRATPRFELPRVVVRDWPPSEFERQLRLARR